MKASLKGRYDADKSTAAVTLAVNAGDVKLRASMTDATVIGGPSLNGLALAVEKPGFFIVDYNVPKKVIPCCLVKACLIDEKAWESYRILSTRVGLQWLVGILTFLVF